MLERIKTALQISSDDFDAEITSMITEAVNDMGFADITKTDQTDESIAQCITLYCCYRFELLHGSLDRSEALKKIYDEQKATLGMATGYTDYDEEM